MSGNTLRVVALVAALVVSLSTAGVAAQPGPGRFNATILGDESDHYAVSVTPGERLTVTVTEPRAEDGDEAAVNPGLVLRNANGEFIADNETGAAAPVDDHYTHSLDREFQQSQTVYVQVTGEHDPHDAVPYSLAIESTGGTTPTATPAPTQSTPETTETLSYASPRTATPGPTDSPSTPLSTPAPTQSTPATETPDAPATSADGPGFGVAVAVVGLLAATLLARRSR